MLDHLSCYASNYIWIIPAVDHSVVVANQVHNCLGKIAKKMPVTKSYFAIANLLLLSKVM